MNERTFSAAVSDRTTQRWQLLETLFHRAGPYPVEERAELVRGWCGEDTALAEELLALLASDAAVEEQIRAGAAGDNAEGLPDVWLGRVLGSYQLLRQIGRGGMGVVYLGEREREGEWDGAGPRAAVKVIGRHLQSTPAVQQFDREREALAGLQHPHVARLLDGGVTGEGLPFLVMELVEGRRLDEAADAAETSAGAVLRWMLQLCEAVEYVHRHLMLHRDLKPGNVMVDGQGAVKLLDFGTAKLLDAATVTDSELTQAGMRAVTLQYASPELLDGGAVTTAADVYSLGVMLYRLLTGGLPAERAPGGGLPKLEAQAGKTMPAGMARDLNAVIGKATAAGADERYGRVELLRADLERVLARRPVAARNGTWGYRAVRFAQRRKLLVMGLAAVLLLLAAGVAAMVRQTRAAQVEQKRAEAGVEQERLLAHALLFDYFEQLKEIPGSTKAQHQAVTDAVAYLDGLAGKNRNRKLELDSVQAYTQMGALLGSPYQENLGDEAGAIQTLHKAIHLSQELLREEPADLKAMMGYAAANLVLGQVYLGAGDARQALGYLQPAAEMSGKLAQAGGADALMLAQSGRVMNTLGDVYGAEGETSLGDPKRAVESYGASREYYERSLKMDPGCANCRRGLAIALWQLGMRAEYEDADRGAALYAEGMKALAGFSAAEQGSPRVLRADNTLRQRLGGILLRSGRAEEGMAMLQTVHARLQATVKRDAEDARAAFELAMFDIALAKADAYLKKDGAEREADREMLANLTALVKKDPKSELYAAFQAAAMVRVGSLEAKLGEREAGLRLQDEGLAKLVAAAEKPHAEQYVLALAAEFLTGTKRNAAVYAPVAVTIAQRAVAASRTPTPSDYLALAEAQRWNGEVAAAGKTAGQAVAMLHAHPKASGYDEEMAEAAALVPAR